MRQQIPSTYIELEKTVLEARAAEAEELRLQQGAMGSRRRRKRLNAGYHKKASKAYDELQNMFVSIESLFQECAPSMVVVALGSSPGTAIEKFALHFGYPPQRDPSSGGSTSSGASCGGASATALTEHQLNLCTRKLIRGIFQNAAELFQIEVRPTKMFVMARARPSSSTESSFVMDWNLNPLKLRKGKKGTPVWIVRVRGVGSADMEEEMTGGGGGGGGGGEGGGGEGGVVVVGGGLKGDDAVAPTDVRVGAVMSLSDDPADFAGEATRVVGVSLSLLPNDGQREIFYKYSKGFKHLKSPPSGNSSLFEN